MTAAQNPKGERLEKAQQTTQVVQAEIERAADQAAVIGTVLAQELPDEVQVGDVAVAIEQTEALEQKLEKSAQALAEVTAELAQEIAHGKAVTKQLDRSEARAERLSDEIDAARKG